MSTSSGAAVSVPMEVRLLVPARQALPLPVYLRYSIEDPYAVSLAFQGPDEEVVWVFARDLLAEGLESCQGEGDVTIRPLKRGSRALLLIRLASPEGTAELEANAEEVAAFVELCENLLPRGSEHTVLDVDVAVAALLA